MFLQLTKHFFKSSSLQYKRQCTRHHYSALNSTQNYYLLRMLKCQIRSCIYYAQARLELSRKVVITSQKTMPISSSSSKNYYKLVNKKNSLQLMITRIINVVTHRFERT